MADSPVGGGLMSGTEMGEPDTGVPDIDVTKPHPARMYDYYIGGKNHFAADRLLADKALASWPAGRIGLRENRAFLGRAVRYLAADAGIRQFLDLGSGLPATNNVHEVAQGIAPSSRVVYVDSDPLVLAHARALLTSTSAEGRTAYMLADIRHPSAILSSPIVRSVLDFSQPIALMLVASLHFLHDEDKPSEVVGTLLDALPSGSYLAASHMTLEHDPGVGGGQQAYLDAGIPMHARDADEFAALVFGGLEMVPPGVVLVSEWRRDTAGPLPTPAEVSCYGGVARKV